MWTVQEWERFGERCQGLQRDMEIITSTLNRKLKIREYERVFRVKWALNCVATEAENAAESDHPHLRDRVIDLMHGETRGVSRDEFMPSVGFIADVLGGWQDLIGELLDKVEARRPRTPKLATRIRALLRAIDRAVATLRECKISA